MNLLSLLFLFLFSFHYPLFLLNDFVFDVLDHLFDGIIFQIEQDPVREN